MGPGAESSVVEPPEAPAASRATASRATAERRIPAVSFRSLVYSGEARKRRGGGLTMTVSLAVHSLLIAALVLVPVLIDDFLPDPDRTVRAFFVAPSAMAPPPPPPPPPAARARTAARAPVVTPPRDESPRFVAPVEVPDEIVLETGIDLGVEGGVAGGVEGGVPGGVVGGIVGGLPQEVKQEVHYIRVGGNLKAPKLVRQVQPEYPALAQQARVQGLVILEARVGADGAVQSARVLRSIPLLDEAAMAAVQQWRYQPLLLNGIPMPFVVTVTVVFKVQ